MSMIFNDALSENWGYEVLDQSQILRSDRTLLALPRSAAGVFRGKGWRGGGMRHRASQFQSYNQGSPGPP